MLKPKPWINPAFIRSYPPLSCQNQAFDLSVFFRAFRGFRGQEWIGSLTTEPTVAAEDLRHSGGHRAAPGYRRSPP